MLILQCTKASKLESTCGLSVVTTLYKFIWGEYEIFSCYDSLYIFIIFLIIIIDFTHQSEVDLCTTVHFPNLLLVCTSKACVSYENHWLIAKLKLMYKLRIKRFFMVIKNTTWVPINLYRLRPDYGLVHIPVQFSSTYVKRLIWSKYTWEFRERALWKERWRGYFGLIFITS